MVIFIGGFVWRITKKVISLHRNQKRTQLIKGKNKKSPEHFQTKQRIKRTTMTEKERNNAARAIFKTYEETEAKLSKIASKAREYVRKVDEAIEDDEKNFNIAAAVSIYHYLEEIEGAQRVASKLSDLRNRVRIDGTKMDFSILTNRLVLITREAEVNLNGIEEWMHLFD